MINITPILSIHEGDVTLQPLLKRFLCSISKYLSDIRDAIRNNDEESFRKSTHDFRGCSATFGFPQVASTIQKLEDSYKGSQEDNFRMEDVETAYNLLLNQSARLMASGDLVGIDMLELALVKI